MLVRRLTPVLKASGKKVEKSAVFLLTLGSKLAILCENMESWRLFFGSFEMV
jgi:hypothetical protein